MKINFNSSALMKNPHSQTKKKNLAFGDQSQQLAFPAGCGDRVLVNDQFVLSTVPRDQVVDALTLRRDDLLSTIPTSSIYLRGTVGNAFNSDIKGYNTAPAVFIAD